MSAALKLAASGVSLNAPESPYRLSWTILPGCSPRNGSCRTPWLSARMRSVLTARSGMKGSAWKLLTRLSRPSSAIDQGSPVAGSAAWKFSPG